MTWFSFVVTWFICFNHSKWSSKRTPRYFTVLVGVKCFPSSLNLRLWSIFFKLERKMINSVFVKLRDSLLAFRHWDRFPRSKFICLALFFSELPHCSLLVSSARWQHIYINHWCTLGKVVVPGQILQIHQLRLVWAMNQNHIMWQIVLCYLDMIQTNFSNQISQVKCWLAPEADQIQPGSHNRNSKTCSSIHADREILTTS